MRMLLEMLARVENVPKTNLGDTFHDLAERIKRRGMLIIFSDLFDDPAEILRGLQHFKHRRHEVLVFHILDRDELDFPFRDSAIFEGMEGEDALMAEPNALRREYLKAFGAYTETLKRGCRELDMDYQQLVTDQPVGTSLSNYLARRMQRA
jgi:hypothetical protein